MKTVNLNPVAAKQLKDWVEESGFSISKLATLSGVNATTISTYVNSKRKAFGCHREKLDKVLSVLGRHPQELYDETTGYAWADEEKKYIINYQWREVLPNDEWSNWRDENEIHSGCPGQLLIDLQLKNPDEEFRITNAIEITNQSYRELMRSRNNGS